MKKIINVLLALAVFAGAFMLSGCGIREYAKYDTWYKYKSANGIDIPVGATGTENSETAVGQMMENAELYVCYNETNGLKIAVQSTKEQKIEIAGGLLETSVDVVTGGTKEYTKEEFGPGKWTTLIVVTGKFEESKAPKIVTNPEQCINITNNEKFTFQWKRVLREILINKLLGE